MICVLFVAVTLARGCHCSAHNSSETRRTGDGGEAVSVVAAAKVSQLPAGGDATKTRVPSGDIAAAARVPDGIDAAVARRSGSGDAAAARRTEDLAATLRRQLMRDNYDYTNTHTDDEKHTQKDFPPEHIRSNETDQPDQLEEPEEAEEPEEPEQLEEQEEPDQLEELEEQRNDNYPHESQYERRDSQYDVPDGVDPADTHDLRYLVEPQYDTREPDRRDNDADRVDYEHAYYSKHHAVQVAPVRHVRARDNYAEPHDALHSRDTRRPHVTRDNKLRSYEPRVHGRVTPPQPQHPLMRGHNISRKDLYFYVDDDRLRRHNDVSADLSTSDADNVNPPMHRAGGARRGNSVARTKHKLHRYERKLPRSQLVTVSPSNVTYKLLTMKSREGRRSGARRILEERGAESVALISLDQAPVPALRLPRARRQYMRDKVRDDQPLRDIRHAQHTM